MVAFWVDEKSHVRIEVSGRLADGAYFYRISVQALAT